MKEFAGGQAGAVSISSSASIKLEPVYNAATADSMANLEHTLNAYGFLRGLIKDMEIILAAKVTPVLDLLPRNPENPALKNL